MKNRRKIINATEPIFQMVSLIAGMYYSLTFLYNLCGYFIKNEVNATEPAHVKVQ